MATPVYPFLSDAWFSAVEALIAEAGDLQIPPAMKQVALDITVTGSRGDVAVHVVDGVFGRGPLATAPTKVRLDEAIARKIFVEADAVAGVQAFLAGEIHVDGDLAKLVAMQTTEPSPAQVALAHEIAAITS